MGLCFEITGAILGRISFYTQKILSTKQFLFLKVLLASEISIYKVTKIPTTCFVEYLMETLTMRFPHLGEMIFDYLDNQSLAKCKIVSKTWNIYIVEQRFYGIRIIKETVERFHKLSNPWFEVFKKANTENIVALKNCFDQFDKQRKQKPHRFLKEITPLHISAGAGNILLYEAIHKLAKNKQPRTEDGHEPVIYAINRGHVKMALFIIERMVDKNPRDVDGFTPLHYAARFGHLKILEMIMEAVQNKNPMSNNRRVTPLHLAAMHGRVEVIDLFMKMIKDKHPRTLGGATPLHMAARNGHVKVCMLILQSARIKNPRNGYGETPLTVARENGQFKVCWLLEKIWNCVT